METKMRDDEYSSIEKMKSRTEKCIYCNKDMFDMDRHWFPGPNDNEGWKKIAENHDPLCPWIATRGFKTYG